MVMRYDGAKSEVYTEARVPVGAAKRAKALPVAPQDCSIGAQGESSTEYVRYGATAGRSGDRRRFLEWPDASSPISGPLTKTQKSELSVQDIGQIRRSNKI